MKEIHIGVRFDFTAGIVFFGLDQINHLLSNGIKILEVLIPVEGYVEPQGKFNRITTAYPGGLPNDQDIF